MKKWFLVPVIILAVLIIITSCSKSTEPKNQVDTPVFSPAGGTYTEAQEVTINCETEGATVYYTLDASDPDTTSILYEGPITISETITLKARAYKEWSASEISMALYTT